jgi:glycosyltransferase involved in cell wall biosynthesis
VKEALASMTPVVSVPVGDVPALLADLPGCAIVERDPTILADAVVAARALRDPALRRRAREFSYERIATQIVDIYERVRERSVRTRRASEARTDDAV